MSRHYLARHWSSSASANAGGANSARAAQTIKQYVRSPLCTFQSGRWRRVHLRAHSGSHSYAIADLSGCYRALATVVKPQRQRAHSRPLNCARSRVPHPRVIRFTRPRARVAPPFGIGHWCGADVRTTVGWGRVCWRECGNCIACEIGAQKDYNGRAYRAEGMCLLSAC